MEIFVGVLLLFAVITVLKGVRVVPQGYEWTVERFGKYTHTLSPGLGFIIPWVDGVGRKLNMMEQVMDVPSQDVITKDNAVVKVDGVVYFQVLDAAKAAYEVATLEIAILNLVMTNIRTAIGSMALDESLSHRDEINTKVLVAVDQATHPWGVKVNRIELKDIHPPKDLIDAMAKQMKAEREKRANILEAEAKATQMVSDAIAQGDVQAINYFIAQKYVEALKDFAASPNQKLLMLPMETTGVLGSLAGIAELAKAVKDRDVVAAPPRVPGQPQPRT